ncbi:MAG: hypothetical protein V7629_11190 [Motiliproteus sp.]
MKKNDGAMLWCWGAGVAIVGALIAALSVRGGLNILTQTSAEINSIATLLDSARGLRSLLIAFSNQCSQAQESWLGALNTSLGLMFLVCLLAFVLLIALVVQINKNRRLTLRLSKMG